MKKVLSITFASIGLFVAAFFVFNSNKEDWRKPLIGGEEEEYEYEEEEFNQEEYNKKTAVWDSKEALSFQKLLKKHSVTPRASRARGDVEQFGSLQGSWYNRAAMNMPAAYLFTEMLDGTDTIYGVSFNHYSGEYNSRSYIWKGTVYNPKTGTEGDDFKCLTRHWPNKYQDLIAFKNSGKTRLIALIQSGPVYWSEDDGKTWNSPTGLPNVVYSIAMNRQDGRIYATNGTNIYLSTDNGDSFSTLQNFGSYGDATLYSPRYGNQPDAEKVYLAREGKFYELNTTKTSFIEKGTYLWSGHGRTRFTIGGDSRKLYVTENSKFWVSTNQGVTWTQKYPNGNWYGDRTGTMSAGWKMAVSPEDADDVMGGYAQPVFSNDGLNTTVSSDGGWGYYQNGTGLSLAA